MTRAATAGPSCSSTAGRSSGESWSEQIGALRDVGYRFVAYDRRGLGRTDKPGKGYECDTLADDLDGVLSEPRHAP